MPKFTSAERQLIKNIVSMYSIKKISDSEIIEEIYQKTGKMLVQKSLFYLRRRIKQDSYEW